MLKKENRELFLGFGLLVGLLGGLLCLMMVVIIPLEKQMIEEPRVVMGKHKIRVKERRPHVIFKGEQTGEEFEMFLHPDVESSKE